jgi:uncharacterized membrane protein
MTNAMMELGEAAGDERESGLTHGRNVASRERELSILFGAALVMFGLSRKSATGMGVAALGAGLLARGATGYCPLYDAAGVNTAASDTQSVVRASRSVRVEHSVTVNRRRSEVYDFWRDFENLPRFMKNVESVERLGDGLSRWRTAGPLDGRVEWEAEIINEVPGELIAWRTVDAFDVAHAGSVRFEDAAGGRGTVVRVEIEYSPFGGKPGALVAKILGEDPDSQVEEDLRRFKQIMEAGEVPTVEGQPQGGSRRTGTNG